MAKIEFKNPDKYNAVELSYMELCYMLMEDIETDVSIPKNEKVEAKETLASLMDILVPYSG